MDIAYTLPIYQPAEFKSFNDLATTTALLPTSPLVGEMVPLAVYTELGWSDEKLVSAFEERGITPLTPFIPTAGYYSACASPTNTLDDWSGRQIRIGSAAQNTMFQEIGASPVSMAYTETYEALQRGTVDCNLGPSGATAESGIVDVAPHIGYMTDSSFPRAGGAFLAGSSFEGLPLAYQQIIFDSNALAAGGNVQGFLDGVSALVTGSKDAGGSITPYDDPMQDRVSEIAQDLAKTAIDNDNLPDDTEQRIHDGIETWTTKLEELGYADEGSTEDFDQWYDPETDFMPFSEAVYESSSAMDHRPS